MSALVSKLCTGLSNKDLYGLLFACEVWCQVLALPRTRQSICDKLLNFELKVVWLDKLSVVLPENPSTIGKDNEGCDKI